MVIIHPNHVMYESLDHLVMFTDFSSCSLCVCVCAVLKIFILIPLTDLWLYVIATLIIKTTKLWRTISAGPCFAVVLFDVAGLILPVCN